MSFFFSLLEVYFHAFFLIMLFTTTFLQSFLNNNSFVDNNPSTAKHVKKQTIYLPAKPKQQKELYAILLLFLLNNNTGLITSFSNQFAVTLLPLLLIGLIFGLQITTFFNKFILASPEYVAQAWTTTNAFLYLFLPFAAVFLASDNIIDLVIPLEMFSFLFYFIFLEYSAIKTKKQSKFKIMLRNFLYYYWLTFLGSVFFLVSIFVLLSALPTTTFLFITKYSTISNLKQYAINGFFLCFLVGFFVKMGSLFFFFFKAGVYKIITPAGLIVLSVFTVLIYLTFFYFFYVQLPPLAFWVKWTLIPLFSLFVVWLLVFFNISFTNFYLFLGVSSVLSGVFCILLIL